MPNLDIKKPSTLIKIYKSSFLIFKKLSNL